MCPILSYQNIATLTSVYLNSTNTWPTVTVEMKGVLQWCLQALSNELSQSNIGSIFKNLYHCYVYFLKKLIHWQ